MNNKNRIMVKFATVEFHDINSDKDDVVSVKDKLEDGVVEVVHQDGNKYDLYKSEQ